MARGHARRERHLGRRIRARRDEVSAAARSRDLLRRSGAQRRAVLQAARRPSCTGRRVLVSRSSMTSVALLELLFENVWDAKPAFVPSDAELVGRRALRRRGARRAARHRRRGAAPLVAPALARARTRPTTALTEYRYAYDLGGEWKAWTGLPFVFAVWVAQRTAPVADALAVHAGLDRVARLGAAAPRHARRAGGDRDRRAQAGVPRVPVGARLRTVVPAPRGTDRVLPAARGGGEGAGWVAGVSCRRPEPSTSPHRIGDALPARP